MIAGEFPRVLIAAAKDSMACLRHVFTHDPLDHWDVVEADSFSQARFCLQHNACDVLLVHHGLYDSEGPQGLAWLAWQRHTPVVFVAADNAEHFRRAYELGIHFCVPHGLMVAQPALLLAAMEQAIQAGELRHRLRHTRERLSECQRHVDRLVSMMWRSSQRQADLPWLSQRSMLERLHEELGRVERHKVPLTVAIGELQPAEDAEGAWELPDWAAQLIARGKRRCDVAGQYGPHGFMLLLVQTPIKGGINACRRLRNVLEHPPEETPPPRSLRAYFGISSTAVNQADPAALLRAAEQNLVAARTDTRERIVVD